MANEAKELERTMDNIVNLLHEANKPAEGLATKFGSFTSESKSMEVIMRLASGTGLWRALNKVKAVGISIAQWNKNASEAREEASQMYTSLAKQVKITQDLKNLSKELTENKLSQNIIQSDMYIGLKELYGKENAILMLREKTTDALGAQTGKMKELIKLSSDEDLLSSLPAEAYNVNVRGRSAFAEASRRGLGKLTKTTKQVTTYSGKKKNIPIQFFDEYGPVKKFFMVKWRGLVNTVISVGQFISGLSKMIKAYLMGALSIIGSFLMWGAVIVLAVILLKPVFLAIWEAIKKHGPELMDKLKIFYVEMKNILTPIWEKMKEFGKLLINPKSTFNELVISFVGLIWVMLKGLVTYLFKIAWPLLIETWKTIFKVLWSAAGSLWETFTSWVINSIIDVYWWVIEKVGQAVLDFLGEDTVATILTALDTMIAPIADFCAWAGSSDRWWIKDEAISPAALAAHTETTDQIRALGAQVSGSTTPTINTNRANQANLIGQLQGEAAMGGFIGRSGRWLVGERGPEIVNLPAGSNVTPNHKIGNTINVHVNGRLGASDTELRDIAKRVGSMINREINRTTNAGVRL